MIEREYYSNRHIVNELGCTYNQLIHIKKVYKQYLSPVKRFQEKDLKLVRLILELRKDGLPLRSINKILDEM